MGNQLDKLFKDKLAGHTLPPSPQAWSKVEAGLSKTNKGVMVFRIAASVLLASALAASMVWIASRQASIPLSLTQNTAKKQAPLKAIQPSKIEKKNTHKPAGADGKRILPHPNPPETATIPIEVSQPHALSTTQDHNSKIDSTQQPIVITDPVKLVAIQETIVKPIIIEYRLETISLLPTTESPSTATAQEKSGFRKVIDFALEAKNSSPLGDLREAKDGLFAFNFKKEKQKNAK